jgi:hypothetical protein
MNAKTSATRKPRSRLGIKIAMAIAGVVLAIPFALATPALASTSSSQVIPYSGTGCTGITCIYVNGTGLYVNYATVTNESNNITGQCTISDTNNGDTYYGPTCPPHHAWRLNFYQYFRNQTKICGSISGLDVACIVVHD